MQNKLYFLFLSLNIFITKPSFSFTLPAPPEGFDEFIKNIDMDKLFQDMENFLGSDNTYMPIPQKAEPKPNSRLGEKKSPTKKEDRETSFKKPMDISVNGSTKVFKLPKEKREAFQFYMNDFLKLLETLENKIDSFDLGIPFKEELEDLKLGNKKTTYKELTNNIKIQKGRINSKQLYQRGFYLPSNNKMREEIIKALKSLKNIDQQISKIKKDNNFFKPSSKQEQRIIKKEIKQFFTKTLPSISENLLKVTDSKTINKEIEDKIRKRQQIIQTHKKEQERMYRQTRRPLGRNGRPRQWRRDYGSDIFSPWRKNIKDSVPPTKNFKNFQETKSNAKNKFDNSINKSSRKDEDKNFEAQKKERKGISQIINLKNEIAQTLKNNINKPMQKAIKEKKENDEMLSILTTKNNLSEIHEALNEIKKIKTKLSKTELESFEKTDEYKMSEKFLNEQLKLSIPYIIKLSKFTPKQITKDLYPVFEKEQKSAFSTYQEILNKNNQFKTVALKELEKETKSITTQISYLAKQNEKEIKEIEDLLGQIHREILLTDGNINGAIQLCTMFENATTVKVRITYNQPNQVKALAQLAKKELNKSKKTLDEIVKQLDEIKKIKELDKFKVTIEKINNIQKTIIQTIDYYKNAQKRIEATVTLPNVLEINLVNTIINNLDDLQKDSTHTTILLDSLKAKYETILQEFQRLKTMLSKEPRSKNE